MRRALVVVLSTLLAFAAAELGLRVFAPVEYERPADRSDPGAWTTLVHQPSAVPGLDYEIAPNRRGSGAPTREGINRYGFRGREPGAANPAGARANGPAAPGEASPAAAPARIVALGDSFTYGLGVAAGETWPAALHRRLRETPEAGAAEVLNLGVTAYSLHDVAAVLEHEVAELRPDLVLVGYVLNDPLVGTGGQPIRVFYHRTRWWQHSHLLRLFVKARRDWAVRRAGGDYVRAFHVAGGDWDTVPARLADMRRASGELGLDVVFVVWPMIPESWEAYAYDDIHERVGQAIRDAGFPVLDLRAALSRVPADRLRLPGDWHPSARGYEVAARAIGDYLLAEGFLPREPARAVPAAPLPE